MTPSPAAVRSLARSLAGAVATDHRPRRRSITVVLIAVATALATGCGGAPHPRQDVAAAPDAARARQLAEVPLWPRGAPGAQGEAAEDRPAITPFLPLPGRANGSAAVVFPGGGYGHLATEKEGVTAARWLTSTGVAAFVVRYRLGPRYHHPAMLQDAQRAVRLVRAEAARWSVDPGRVGVVGFSAGGHMASTAGTHFDAGDASSSDSVERVSSRPNFMILVYPVITMEERWTHRGSRDRLLGASPPAELVQLMSNERQVTSQSPPTFIVSITDDAVVPVENSLMFYRALLDAKVPVELHVFESGKHGFGLAPDDPVLSTWPTLATAWMRRHGWLGPLPSASPAPARR